jgi:hypothetical protein
MGFAFDNLLSEQANIGQSRSSVLNPPQWMVVIMVAGLTGFVFAHAPNWLIILMAVLLSATGYSGEGEHRFRREAERHCGAKVNSSRSVATLAW